MRACLVCGGSLAVPAVRSEGSVYPCNGCRTVYVVGPNLNLYPMTPKEVESLLDADRRTKFDEHRRKRAASWRLKMWRRRREAVA